MNFRYDINMLRAIAVIAVVLFHFYEKLLPGGFVGVDVFFVISGFLMTGIIVNKINENTFSILKFYIARARRILPALFVLCTFLAFFGALKLSEYDFKILSTHIAGSLAFLSNIIYLNESGYFDVSSNEKWLLHTWSLSVEWQFYVLYPIFFVLLYNVFLEKTVKKIFILIMVASFVINLIITYKWPTGAYFLLPSRIWELMVGGLLYLYPIKTNKLRKTLLFYLGMTLIFISFLFFYSELLWPGYFALVPIIGASLVIMSNYQSAYFIKNKYLQFVGVRSYSIYLWHWPIVVFGSNYVKKDFETEFIILGIFLSLILGSLSYKYVESFRKNKYAKKSALLYIILFMFVVFISVSASKFSTQNNSLKDIGAQQIRYNHLNKLEINGVSCNNRGINDSCKFEGNKYIILIGDSHASTLSAELYNLASNNNMGFINLTKYGCLSLSSVIRYKDCTLHSLYVDRVIESLGENNIIVYASRLPAYFNYRRVNNKKGGVEEGYGVKLTPFENQYNNSNYLENLPEKSSELTPYDSQLSNKKIPTLITKNISDFSIKNKLVLIYPMPEQGWDVIKKVAENLVDIPYSEEMSYLMENRIWIDKKIHDLRSAIPNKIYDNVKGQVYRVYPETFFCNDIKGKCYLYDEGGLFYFDSNHPSSYASEIITEDIRNKLRLKK